MSSRRHWVEDEYEYTRPARYSNTSSNVYVTPQRYVGKTYVRTIPNVAHQRLTTTSYPPRSYTPHHYDEERILGYRVPPSSHAITTTSYRPWIEEEPMVDYMPYQPTRHIDYRPSYADTWKSTISPSTRARWHTDEDEDYMLSHDRRVVKRSNDVMTPYRSAVVTGPHHYSYADKYQADLEDSLESSGAIVPGNYFAARHTEPTTSIMLRRPIPKPRGPYEDLADEYPAHGRKYVVVPMRNVYNNIYNMSYYRKPMQQANIGRGHLACIRFIGSKAIHPLRAEKEKYDITKIPREVASLSLYGNMIAAVRDHKLVRDTELRSTKRELRSIQLESDKIEDKQTSSVLTKDKTKPKDAAKTDATKTDENKLTADENKAADQDDKSTGSEGGKKEKKHKKKHKQKVDVDLDDEEALMRMVEEELEKERKAAKKKAGGEEKPAEEGAEPKPEGEVKTEEAKAEGGEKAADEAGSAPEATGPTVAMVKPRTSVDIVEPETKEIVTKRTIVIEGDEASAQEEINRLINETKRRISSHMVDAGQEAGDSTIKITRVVKVSGEPEVASEPVVITEVNDADSKPSTAEPTVTEPAQ